MIEHYTGTIGSGKSYHTLEDIIDWLAKGKYVIANFPLHFTEGMINKGYNDRFMYIPDDFLMGSNGVKLLFHISRQKDEDGEYMFFGEESSCLVVIDEAGNHFPPEQIQEPTQKLWNKFFTMSRKLGYDFILVSQIEKQVNRTIRGCVEYEVKHRKANRVFPLKYLPFTIFMYVTYWNKQKISSSSTIFVKKFASLYDTEMLFGNIVEDMNDFEGFTDDSFHFGNCAPSACLREGPSGEGPEGVQPDAQPDKNENKEVS